jgi:hypothetical protein
VAENIYSMKDRILCERLSAEYSIEKFCYLYFSANWENPLLYDFVDGPPRSGLVE